MTLTSCLISYHVVSAISSVLLPLSLPFTEHHGIRQAPPSSARLLLPSPTRLSRSPWSWCTRVYRCQICMLLNWQVRKTANCALLPVLVKGGKLDSICEIKPQHFYWKDADIAFIINYWREAWIRQTQTYFFGLRIISAWLFLRNSRYRGSSANWAKVTLLWGKFTFIMRISIHNGVSVSVLGWEDDQISRNSY